MSEFRVVVVVSADRSDLYFANQLLKRVNVVGVIVENQRNQPDNTSIIIKAIRLAPQPHLLLSRIYDVVARKIRGKFAVYNKLENMTDFGKEGLKLFPGNKCTTLYTSGVNDINSPENIDSLRKMNPDVVAVCGASILKDEILSVPHKGVLNLHGGLSQKYRGLFTTDWAIHNEQPEYVGATVHYVSPGIDDGDIVYQGRPDVELDDNPNSLYVKVVKQGVNMMERAINDIKNDTVCSTPLLRKGDLYLGHMFTPSKRDATWRKLRKGVISDYLSNKEARDKKVLELMVNNYQNVRKPTYP